MHTSKTILIKEENKYKCLKIPSDKPESLVWIHSYLTWLKKLWHVLLEYNKVATKHYAKQRVNLACYSISLNTMTRNSSNGKCPKNVPSNIVERCQIKNRRRSIWFFFCKSPWKKASHTFWTTFHYEVIPNVCSQSVAKRMATRIPCSSQANLGHFIFHQKWINNIKACYQVCNWV